VTAAAARLVNQQQEREHSSMVLSTVYNINIIPNSGIFDLIFHQTWITISILGFPAGGYKLTLIALIILVILALGAAAVIERLTGAKPGQLLLTFLITLLGAYVFEVYVRLPFDIVIEGVALVAAFLGAVVIGTFFVLIRNAVRGGK
jgi:hypothetical protein